MARPTSFDAGTALDRAVATFWRHGYAGTTPARLVSELGLSRSSLYSTFGSKGELFHRALQRYAEQTSTALLDALDEGASGAARLRAASHVLADAVVGQPAGCLVTTTAVEVPDDETAAATIRTVLTTQREAFERAVADGVADGSLRADLDPRATATTLLATFNGVQVLARAGLDRPDLVAALDTAVAALGR